MRRPGLKFKFVLRTGWFIPCGTRKCDDTFCKLFIKLATEIKFYQYNVILTAILHIITEFGFNRTINVWTTPDNMITIRNFFAFKNEPSTVSDYYWGKSDYREILCWWHFSKCHFKHNWKIRNVNYNILLKMEAQFRTSP